MSWTSTSSAEGDPSRGGEDQSARLQWFFEHGYLTEAEHEAQLRLFQYERRRWAYRQRLEQRRRQEVRRARAS